MDDVILSHLDRGKSDFLSVTDAEPTGSFYIEYGSIMLDSTTGFIVDDDRNFTIIDDRREGLSLVFFEGTSIVHIISMFRRGKKNGDHIVLYDDGSVEATTRFKDGKEDGTHRAWQRNGTLREISHYKQKKKEGLSTSWDDDGRYRFRLYYWNDKEIGYQIAFRGGNRSNESNSDSYNTIGTYLQYLENGKLGYQREYRE
jgi:hypothetical protein